MATKSSLGKSRKRPTPKHLSFVDAKKLIQNKGYDELTTEMLIQRMSKYPQRTYRRFLTDIGVHLNEVQRDKNKVNTNVKHDELEFTSDELAATDE